MARERLVVSAALCMTLCWLVVRPATVGAQNADPVARRLEMLERRVAELEAELKKARVEQANDRFLQKLYGEWKEEFMLKNGRKHRETDDAVWQLNSDAGSTRTLLAGEVSQWYFGKMTVDTTKSPVWITFHDRDKEGKEVIWPGIISFSQSFLGGNLQTEATIALPMSEIVHHNSGARPTKFESTENKGVIVFTLERIGYRPR